MNNRIKKKKILWYDEILEITFDSDIDSIFTNYEVLEDLSGLSLNEKYRIAKRLID